MLVGTGVCPGVSKDILYRIALRSFKIMNKINCLYNNPFYIKPIFSNPTGYLQHGRVRSTPGF